MSDEWVLFDGDCGICTGFAERWGPSLRAHGFELAPLKAKWVRDRLKLPENELRQEMRVLTRNGQVLGGIDAVLYVSNTIGWARPIYWISYLPGIKPLLGVFYRFVARNRHTISKILNNS